MANPRGNSVRSGQRREAVSSRAFDPGLYIARENETRPGVNPTRILSALGEAKEKAKDGDFDSFVKQERQWLGNNLGPLSLTVDALFKRKFEAKNMDVAGASFEGAILGGAIVRLSIEADEFDADTCLTNLRTWGIGAGGIAYSANISHDELVALHGDEAAKAFGQINSDVARTICATVVGVSLIPAD